MEKKAPHRPPKGYEKEQVLEAIRGSNNIMSKVAERLFCDWSTAKKYVEMWPETRHAMDDELQRAIDLAENKVLRSISLDDINTAKWFLSKKAKDRGYGDESTVNMNVKDVDIDTSALTIEEKRALLKLTKARGNVSTDAKHNTGGTSCD